MTSRAVIDLLYESNPSLTTKKVGVEIELIVLRRMRRAFVKMANKLGFRTGSDWSIVKRAEGFERLYGQVEIDIGKKPWTQIERSLTAMTSWLRHDIPIDFHDKTFYLPIGKVPQTMQAGLHLHFDLDDWFDSPEHFTNFIQNVNQFLKTDMKAMVAAQRYATPQSSGSEYASDWPVEPPRKQDIARFRQQGGEKLSNVRVKHGFRLINIDPDRVRHFVNWWANEMDKTRDQAVNIVSSWEHGTLEFRFPNATLNIASIEGWIEMMAELIDMSREKDYGQFKHAIRRGERKHIGQFMDRRKAAHGDPVKELPWDRYDYEMPRTYRRAGLAPKSSSGS